jgi:hypothetical protein
MDWIFGFIDHVNTQLVITLYRSLTLMDSVLSLLQFPLAVSWQWILTQEL